MAIIHRLGLATIHRLGLAAIHNGCPYAGDIFTFKNSFTAHMCLLYIRNKIEIKYPAFEFSLTKYAYYLLSR